MENIFEGELIMYNPTTLPYQMKLGLPRNSKEIPRKVLGYSSKPEIL